MSLIAGIVMAIFGMERLTRFINRRLDRQRRNDELWERIVTKNDES